MDIHFQVCVLIIGDFFKGDRQTECVYKDVEYGSCFKTADQLHLVFSVLLRWVVHRLTFFIPFSSLHNVLFHSEEKMEHLFVILWGFYSVFSCKTKPEPPTGKTSRALYLNTNYKVSRERKSELANENSTQGARIGFQDLWAESKSHFNEYYVKPILFVEDRLYFPMDAYTECLFFETWVVSLKWYACQNVTINLLKTRK